MPGALLRARLGRCWRRGRTSGVDSTRGSSGWRCRPRDARGGGACEGRAAPRHDLGERDCRRGAAHGDIRGARRRRLIPLAARQRRDGGRPDRKRDLRTRAVDRDGDRDRRRRRDGAGERHGAFGSDHAAAGGREPLREGRRLSGQSRAGARRRAGGAVRGRTRRGHDARRGRRHLPVASQARPHARPVRGPDAGRGFGAGRAQRAPRAAGGVRRYGGRRRTAGARRASPPRRGGHALDPPLPRRQTRAQRPRPSGGQAGRGHRPPRRLPRGRRRRTRAGLAGRGAAPRAPASVLAARATRTATASRSGPTPAPATSSSRC